jgi:hypothetical protein
MPFHPICGRKKRQGASTPLRIFLAVTVRLSACNCVATRRREVVPAFDTDLVGLLRTKESVGLLRSLASDRRSSTVAQRPLVHAGRSQSIAPQITQSLKPPGLSGLSRSTRVVQRRNDLGWCPAGARGWPFWMSRPLEFGRSFSSFFFATPWRGAGRPSGARRCGRRTRCPAALVSMLLIRRMWL